MLKRSLYNVGFTVAMCAVCATMVTFAKSYWGAMYEANLAGAKMAAIIEALGLVDEAPEDVSEVGAIYRKHRRDAPGERVPTYKAVKGGRVVGFAIELNGRGHEGRIHGVLALKPDRLKVKGFRVYEHEEAPVGRCTVDSRRFANRFEGKSIRGPDGVPGMKLVKRPRKINEVKAITGATLTSRALERILLKTITAFVSGRKLVKLELSLPESVAVDHGPIPEKSTARPLSGEPRQPFMVPEGTKLLSSGKPVTASEEDPIIGALKQITDGDKSAGEGGFVELGFGLQHVQVDLGEPYELFAVLIWRDYRSPKIYRDVVVQVADDVGFTKDVRTVFNNDEDNSSGFGRGEDIEYIESFEGKLINVKGVRARCVRVYSSGNNKDDMSRYAEVEVHGKPPGGDEKGEAEGREVE